MKTLELEENFMNFIIPFSRGKWEFCEAVKACVDIPSKFLVRKETLK